MMTHQTVLTIAQEALQVTVMVSAPLLLTALLVGLLVSVFQAATQINEMTLSFIPKLLAMFAVLVIAGPWMLTMLVDYIQRLYSSIPQTIG
jgi:flagellar biosynthetic protein FliQ